MTWPQIFFAYSFVHSQAMKSIGKEEKLLGNRCWQTHRSRKWTFPITITHLHPVFFPILFPSLKDNVIGSGGAKAIGEALRTNTSLKELYIQMAFRLISTFSLHHASSFPNLKGTRLGTTEPKRLENRWRQTLLSPNLFSGWRLAMSATTNNSFVFHAPPPLP